MSITDELREYAHDCCARVDDAIHAIADRIDAEHESACGEAYGNGVQSVALPDMTAYVKLPVDADGEVWRAGDELLDDGMVCEVVGIGPNRLYYYVDATDTVEWTQADSRRHHHAPTVEDVLREFALAVCKDDALTIREGVVEKYAAKLRLAEEVDA